MAKILASAAFKTMVVAAIKKFTAAAILAAVTHALWGVLGAKVAAAIGSAIVPIISVAILGWVAREIVRMPEKLADKLAVEVRANLDGEIGNINQEMATSFYEEMAAMSVTSQRRWRPARSFPARSKSASRDLGSTVDP